ncbi:hypothetical protein AN958_12222 [Leucoagaricus sp. SymC.cos]|nr:hypothetical protein AN958_12222 [Leucoagaricus sp. SymC.cos]
MAQKHATRSRKDDEEQPLPEQLRPRKSKENALRNKMWLAAASSTSEPKRSMLPTVTAPENPPQRTKSKSMNNHAGRGRGSSQTRAHVKPPPSPALLKTSHGAVAPKSSKPKTGKSRRKSVFSGSSEEEGSYVSAQESLEGSFEEEEGEEGHDPTILIDKVELVMPPRKKRKTTKLDAAFAKERPEVRATTSGTAPGKCFPLLSKSTTRWPLETDHRSGGIKNQTPHVRDLIQRAIEICELKMITENAFPEVNSRELFRTAVMREAANSLMEKPKNDGILEYEMLHNRVIEDPEWQSKVGDLAVDCIAHAHTLMRSAALTAIAHYCLGDGPSCVERVSALLSGNTFVYTGHWENVETNGNIRKMWIIDPGQTYLNPAIIKTLRRAWFLSGNSFGAQFDTYYIPSGSRTSEPRFTIPMVALAATAVYAALKMWETGDLVDEPFKGEKYAPIYQRHVTYLTQSRANIRPHYRLVMTTLYKEVRCHQAAHTVQPEETDPFVHFNNMPSTSTT